MKIKSVFSPEFKSYGTILTGYNIKEATDYLRSAEISPDGVTYIASVPELESTPLFRELQERAFGGMEAQLGFCAGVNQKLNCLEYHRSSEFNIAAADAVLLLAHQTDLNDYTLDTSLVEAFFIPSGVGVELFATTLHYAPCSAEKGKMFRMLCALPKGTNMPLSPRSVCEGEDRLLLAKNKWLIAHPESDEAKQGAFVGLVGENIDLF